MQEPHIPKFDPDDVLLSKEMNARHEFLNEMARPINFDSSDYVKSLKVRATARLTEHDRKATYTTKIPNAGSVDFTRFALQLGNYLFNARSLLDNMMWAAVHSQPTGTLTEKEKRNVYFPIAATEADWNSFVGRPYAKVVRQKFLDRIRAVQPFERPDAPGSRAMLYLHRLHIEDKHQTPLSLFMVADPQWPMVFDIRPAGGHPMAPYEWRVEWLNQGQPLVNGTPLAVVRVDRAIKQPKDAEVPLALVSNLDGEHYDLQDLMWDVEAAVLRVVDVVGLNTDFRALLWEEGIAFERERLAASNRSVLDGTDEWVTKYGDGKSPLDETYAELRAGGSMPPLPDETPATSTKGRRTTRAKGSLPPAK